jgi:hypothetical protein
MGLGLIVMSSAIATPSANASADALHAVGGGIMVGAQDQATGLGPMRTVVVGANGSCGIDQILYVKQGGALIERPLTYNTYYGVRLNQTAYGALLDAYVWSQQCNGSQWLYQISHGTAANG